MVVSSRRLAPLFALVLMACASPQRTGPTSAPMRLATSYRIQTHLDAAAAGLLGKTVGGTLLALKNSEVNPARTVTRLMITYGVPGAGVLSHMPDSLRSSIETWANEELDRRGADGKTITMRVSQLVESILDRTRVIVIESELSPEDGGQRGRHSVAGLGFSAFGRSGVIELPDDVAGVIRVENPRISLDAGSASLHIEGHEFAIRFGEAALRLVLRQAGANDLSSLLESAVGCADLATSISDHCLGACISAATLTSLCEDGVHVAAHILETEIRAQRLTVLNIRDGRCEVLVGPNGVVERLVNGHFTILVSLNGEDFTSDAPFEGRRVDEGAPRVP